MWALYDHVDRDRRNTIQEWGRTLETTERAKLNAKLDLLARHGPDLPSKLLAGTAVRTIDKLRINGRVAVRLMLCRGPIDDDKEFTLLLGALERDRKLVPSNAPDLAEGLRQAVVANPAGRRTAHVRF